MELLYTTGCRADLSKPLSLMSIFKCVLWKSSSVFSDWRLLFYGGVPLQSSLLRSDFDVRLAGLSPGTGGHQSLTGVVPAFLPACKDRCSLPLRQVSVKEVPPGCQRRGVPLIQASTFKSSYSECRVRRKHKLKTRLIQKTESRVVSD